jgi:hypothetical protein
MTKFRADYDVKCSIVLPPGTEPFLLRGADPVFEMTFRNASPDQTGHAPALIVEVVADSDSIDHVADKFRTLLADQLDILSFSTHSMFLIDQCRRVVEWEPFQKTRALRPLQKFNPLYPPDPELHGELLDTVQSIVRSKPPDYVQRALRFFRYGILERQHEDQFQHFWLAIETIAEGSKAKIRIPIPCPKCSGELFCATCNETPMRRPMARQAIRQMFEANVKNGAEAYQNLVGTRDHLLHGRSPDSVEAEIGRPLAALVNDAAGIAWHAILNAMPRLDGTIHFANRGGNFANNALLVIPDMQFTYEGDAPHPSEEQIPKVQISMTTNFRLPQTMGGNDQEAQKPPEGQLTR